ncbi:hypothetical protein H8356DRAFT_1015053 [Neocallimastix lanati (nom. inval.)]|nr:hypothetical protein H8356DRAFT_1015053 [Neocallimastix sp. JGI-2020a]
MLGWKYLSLLGLVFIANRVSATGIQECALDTSNSSAQCKDSQQSAFVTGLCLVTEGNDKILYDSQTSGCTKVQNLTANGYYVYKCDTSNACLVYDFTTTLGNGETLHLYQHTGESKLTEGTLTLFLKEDKKLLLTCTSGTCTKVETEGYYVNTGSNIASTTAPLFKVDSTGATPATNVAEGVYLDASSQDTNEATKYSKLIKCTNSGETITCTSSDADTTDVTYVNAAQTTIENALITCESSKCSATAGTPNSIYINSGASALTKAMIKCNNNSCTTVDAAENDYFLIEVSGTNKANSLDNALILCDGSQCTAKTAEADTTYLNAAVTTASQDDLISCTSSGCTTAAGTSGKICLNSASTSLTKAMIKCNDDGCTAENALENDYYLIDGDSNTEKLIKCTSESCGVDTASTGVFLDAGTKTGTRTAATYTNIIICTSGSPITCENPASLTAGYYVDSSKIIVPSATKKRTEATPSSYSGLILCESDGTNVTCAPATGVTEGFYINAVPDTSEKLKNAIIKCTGTSTVSCSILAEVAANSVYLNNASDKKLIQCKTSTDGCNGAESTGTTNAPAYYVNAAVDTDDDYEKLLIRCTSTTDCATADTSENDVYINANFVASGTGDTTNHLIICSNKKCEAKPSAGTTSAIEYYVNAAGTQKLTDTLIVCNGSCAATAQTITDPVTELIFINKNYGTDTVNYLIKCTTENGCVAFGKTGQTADDVEYYVNGAGTALTDSLIKVTFAAPTRRRRDDAVATLVATPEIVATGVVANDIYINASTGLLIQCTSTKCEAYAGTENADVPAFYRNAAVASVTTDYAKKIIQCSDTACTPVEEINENDVYLNGYSETDSKPIIICAGASKACTTFDASGSNVYYVNAGTYTDSTNASYNLIKCTDTTTCTAQSVTLAGTATEYFFVNGNYATDKDAENYLIKCTAENCAVYKNPTPVEGVKEHYVHGEPDTTNKLTNAVIECDMSQATPCTLPTSIADKDVYIDSFNVKNIIRCFTATGCSSSLNDSTSTTSAYYINNATEKSLIKCYNDTGCAIVATDDLKGGKKVFLNANYREGADTTNQLIKCIAAGTCELVVSGATAEAPEFYVNADTKSDGTDYDGATKTEIIRCVANAEGTIACDTGLTTKENDVFINSNFDTADTDKKQLIKCTSDDCVEAAAIEGEETTPVYYVNAGASSSEKLTDTLIKCESSESACVVVVAEEKDIYINALDQQLIICKDASTGCKAVPSTATAEKYQYFLNSSDLKSEGQTALDDDLIKCSPNEEGNNICEPVPGVGEMIYINSFNSSTVISCVSDVGCSAKDSTAEENKPQFFVNGGDIPDGDPLKLDLIKCTLKKSSGKSDGEGSISCDITNGKVGDVYLNGNTDDADNQLIICSETDGCVATPVTLGVESQATSEMENVNQEIREADVIPDTPADPPANETPAEEQSSSSPAPNYYLNSGNEGKDKFEYALIQCASGDDDAVTCDLYKAAQYQVYVNSNDIDNANVPLIKCAKNACSKTASAATEKSKEYYINAGDIDETPLNYDIIECALEDDTVKCTCKAEADTTEGVYVNSNYSESGDNKQLIQCSSDNGCVGVATVEKGVEYYVNAESVDLNNAIIFCSNKKCEKQTPAAVPMYYIGKDGDNVNGLIKCVKSTAPAERRRKRDDEEKCTLTSAFTSEGYYLNSGYNKSTNQTIICDSTEGCSTVKVDLGYYVNAGNDEKKIIKCEKEGNECEEEDTKSCPSAEKAVPGNYCYEDGQLKFFTANNSTAITASKSDDTYAFATIPSNGFPGIKSEIGSLFKISRYFINRFYQSGVVMIDKNGKLVDSLSGDTSDISLYDCNDSTKVCTERPGCTSNTYMFDSENRKAVFCNDGNLEYASFTGYVVDGNRVTSGTKHPYIIQCENGEKCVSLKPKSSTYYENSGYDSTTNSLIQCNNSNCMTVAAEVGYYVAHGHTDNNGVIKCTTATSCSYSQVKNKVKYVNAGFDKRNNAIIECKGGKCSVAKAKSGYYLTHTSTLLIQCTSPTSCAEFTPTVNYYDNADSSESSNTIINCVQNSNVVTCSSEATNNGFYMSSLSNVLIRCKAGHKCKTITVKNGIFRGALKGLTSNKRSDNAQNVQNVHGRDDDDLEEDGKMVNLRDNSDDAYGIIRCVAGKCAALSASELAAIPMCEFNNNKCYITLEYAMTKSATTSIAAGNICTNSDRSVFYFATDTVVVKPNVISGVTSTYVYTTTNSNCLEVNDSYNDMYFTVGSNIYTLDQGSVLQFYETGYYFLNVAKNTLVGGNEIDAYNDENVKLYRCNGSSCSIIDKPDANTYYADVNKRILKYNVNNDVFTFAYEKDIICIFANNKCTPNADLKNQEFCITYKGEIVLATTDIKNRETGECYRAGNINNYIYGYSQHLYHMNQFAAEMVDQTGFYIISLSTNTTVVSKNYKNKNNSIVVYGCNLSSCRVYEPDEDTYYYDAQARNILRYKDGVWSSPSTSGYAYIAIDPTNTYVYKFAKKGDEIIIQGKANYGYYYTVDNEMYHCDQEDGECKPIDETGYYFTNAGEVFSCVHDSEGLEATECVKQNCVSGQYYYIDEAYYRCEVSSLLVPVVSRYCSYDDNVVVNFPLALTEEFPDKIKQAVDDIQKNNNSTAVVTRRGKNYLEAVSGVFTNCTYNVEETKSTFDLVCVNNYVRVDDETDEVKICNVDQLGYVECIEDEDNPEKCSVSGAFRVWKPSVLLTAVLLLFTLVMNDF